MSKKVKKLLGKINKANGELIQASGGVLSILSTLKLPDQVERGRQIDLAIGGEMLCKQIGRNYETIFNSVYALENLIAASPDKLVVDVQLDPKRTQQLEKAMGSMAKPSGDLKIRLQRCHYDLSRANDYHKALHALVGAEDFITRRQPKEFADPENNDGFYFIVDAII